jgi:hypothetical protein
VESEFQKKKILARVKEVRRMAGHYKWQEHSIDDAKKLKADPKQTPLAK